MASIEPHPTAPVDLASQHVIERLGLELEIDGLPRSAGRILGRLLLSPEPLSLDRLAEELRISKAGTSANARLLERAGVLERTCLPGDRRDFYHVSPAVHVRMLAHRIERLQSLLAIMEEARESQAAGPPEVRERLDAFAAFFAHMLEAVRSARERWMNEHEEPSVPRRHAWASAEELERG